VGPSCRKCPVNHEIENNHLECSSVDSGTGRGDWSPVVPGQGTCAHLFGE